MKIICGEHIIEALALAEGRDDQGRRTMDVLTTAHLSPEELEAMTTLPWEAEDGRLISGLDAVESCSVRFVASVSRETELEKENAELLKALASLISQEQAAQLGVEIPALTKIVQERKAEKGDG